uniref:UDP-3-O-3-hydroxymyristoyl N-acetylglucosamine deacetylase n=1 Tax=Rhizophora mucronata TaxID=61149 RepID=A0A2P2K9M1_RHIMU
MWLGFEPSSTCFLLSRPPASIIAGYKSIIPTLKIPILRFRFWMGRRESGWRR